jgi:hypothetical protein
LMKIELKVSNTFAMEKRERESCLKSPPLDKCSLFSSVKKA